MSTETFKCKHIEDREKSMCVEYLGKRVFLPLSQVERVKPEGNGMISVTIPYWLYSAKFEED